MKIKATKMGVVCFTVLGFVVAGCAQVPRKGGFEDVRRMVDDRVDYRVVWNQGLPEDREVQQAVDALLAKELTVDSAIQIALLNNARLQATYEELGVSQAEVVQAGLLQNPNVFGSIRFPDVSSAANNLEFGIVQNFMDILMLPARKKIAATRFEQIKAMVADEILSIVSEVEKAYFEVQGAANNRQVRACIVETSGASHEFAQRLYEAGNIGELSLANEQGQYEEMRVRLAESDILLSTARERLTRLMGLWGVRIDWQLPPRLPDVPAQEIPLEQLEPLAVANRLDLESARREIDFLAQVLGTTVTWRWIGDMEVGVSAERDTDRTWVIGPELAVELPLFDQRQAKVAQGEALLRQKVNELTALAVDVRSEVRTLRNKMVMQRYLINHYKQVIVPLRERIVALTLEKYNYMLVGAFDVLLAKQQEFDTYGKYLKAVRDYWVIRAELRKAVGGRLPAAASGGSLLPPPVSAHEPVVPPDDGRKPQQHKH
jgi:cobalt-zinc-cadmium efflux system outer membrane protein